MGADRLGAGVGEGGDFELRETGAPYPFNFGMKNEEIGLNNTILWNNYPDILNG